MAAFALLAAMLVNACTKKDLKPEAETPEEVRPVSKIRKGIDPAHDTTFVIAYDEAGRVESIEQTGIRSGATYKLTTGYDEAGLLTGYIEEGWVDLSHEFSYNEKKQMTEYKMITGRGDETFKFEYASDGSIAKKSRYTTNADTPFEYWTYVIADGNITGITTYRNGSQVDHTTLTYTTKPNVMKAFGLLNTRNTLGITYFANLDTWFNKNMIATTTFQDGVDRENSYVYTLNDQEQLTDVVVRYGTYYTYTWKLSY